MPNTIGQLRIVSEQLINEGYILISEKTYEGSLKVLYFEKVKYENWNILISTSLFTGGAERQAIWLANSLSKSDYKVNLLILKKVTNLVT